ncbi:hypothetical protein PAEVO_10630 [Paenibacillus sp. GM2FR]|uniref:hypothetical protein n=1 Tax=Paenibacillus sp. GM2FR TaxID=2059268 RepID=UPI000C26ED7C|nr:hypothetical protein [Paenibacillus sp. GM2FR]PJN54342.1 hypothetical protein PAEVO_10630 [Paenibacillus sp. GM2FR]
MIKPYTKAIIIEPYYECPIWIENDVTRKEYTILDAESKEEDVVLFLILLFGYNHINVKQSLEESFNELFNEERVALSGGIGFFEDNKLILPSCCCGLEDWSEVSNSVKSRTSPWLGHDPNPGMIYDENHVKVWSDDPDRSTETQETLYFIEYEYEELLRSLDKTKEELTSFIREPLFRWINRKSVETANQMIIKMEEWFFKEY